MDTEKDWAALAKRIKRDRIDAGYGSQEEFAEAVHMGIKTVSRLETGIPVGSRTLRMLESFFGLPDQEYDDVLLGKEDGAPEATPARGLDLTDRWQVLRGLQDVAKFGEAAFTAALEEALATRRGQTGELSPGRSA